MPGIGGRTTAELGLRIERFSRSYVKDWHDWLKAVEKRQCVASEFGRVLRRWQACRPNTMRRTQDELCHGPPFLEDLIALSQPHLQALASFDMGTQTSYTAQACDAIRGLWMVFAELSYEGKARDGKTGVVGISKAVLLLTLGRIGPAFDSQVRRETLVGKIVDAEDWLEALKWVTSDIAAFEQANRCTLQEAAPQQFQEYQRGRLYDMALGPG